MACGLDPPGETKGTKGILSDANLNAAANLKPFAVLSLPFFSSVRLNIESRIQRAGWNTGSAGSETHSAFCYQGIRV